MTTPCSIYSLNPYPSLSPSSQHPPRPPPSISQSYHTDPPSPPPSFIHWVAHSPIHHSPIHATVRAFNPLFKSANPAANPAGFLADINPDSELVYPDALLETGFEEIRRGAPWPAEAGERNGGAGERNGGKGEDGGEGEGGNGEVGQGKDGGGSEARPETIRFQGMRVAYFCMDRESSEGEVILNRIVGLKEDTGKD